MCNGEDATATPPCPTFYGWWALRSYFRQETSSFNLFSCCAPTEKKTSLLDWGHHTLSGQSLLSNTKATAWGGISGPSFFSNSGSLARVTLLLLFCRTSVLYILGHVTPPWNCRLEAALKQSPLRSVCCDVFTFTRSSGQKPAAKKRTDNLGLSSPTRNATTSSLLWARDAPLSNDTHDVAVNLVGHMLEKLTF